MLVFLLYLCEGVLFLEDRKNNGNRVKHSLLLDFHGFLMLLLLLLLLCCCFGPIKITLSNYLKPMLFCF